MSDKDLRSQVEGLFSGIVPEPEAEKKDESLLQEGVDPTEAKIAEAQLQHLRATGEDPLERLFREATRARLAGQVERALELYKQIQSKDPTYPNIEMHIGSAEREIARGYIDDEGKFVPGRVIMAEPKPAPRRALAWPILAGAIGAAMVLTYAVIFYFGPSPNAATATPASAVPTASSTSTMPTSTPVPIDTPTPTPTDTPYPTPTHTPLPTDTPTLAPTPMPVPMVSTPTPVHVVSTSTPKVDFKIVKQEMRRIRLDKCHDLPEIGVHVIDLAGEPLDNIRTEIYWDGGHFLKNSGWFGPGYDKATVTPGTFWVKVIGGVPPFDENEYTSEVSRPLSTDQPTPEDLEKAGYCEPGGKCMECGLYSYEVVFQRQW